MNRSAIGLGAALLALTGCQDVIDLDPVDERTPVESRIRPKPISGGTLLVTTHGTAVAADPDRDLIHVVDVSARTLEHTIALEPGDEPGRVVQGSGSRVHVVLRGFGGLATIDHATGTIEARHRLCPDPRGVAFDGPNEQLHVSCADGTLIHLDESGTLLSQDVLQPDLRDVVLDGPVVRASRFRAASLVDLYQGEVNVPDADDGGQAHVAWRTFVDPEGHIRMLHQVNSVSPVPIEPDPEDVRPEGSSPYGGGGGFCQPGISSVALTTFTPEGSETLRLPSARLTVDAAVSPVGGWVALAIPGAEEGTPTMGMVAPDDGGCFLLDNGRTEEQITSVAFATDGTLVMQSREPARLLVQDEPLAGSVAVIELGGEPRYDTGHEIFHRTTDSGLSCATCHPEGTDDGHVWVFASLGERRTQSLDVGLADSAPFHWDGDMNDMNVLMEEVLAHRMGGKRQSSARADSFLRWMFAQQRPPADAGRDDPARVQTGKELFVSLDCGRCHTGNELGGSLTTPIRGQELQVPSLHRVSLRPPFMHDGRSPTLDHAVRDMITSTTAVDPSDDDVEALSAYMRTL